MGRSMLGKGCCGGEHVVEHSQSDTPQYTTINHTTPQLTTLTHYTTLHHTTPHHHYTTSHTHTHTTTNPPTPLLLHLSPPLRETPRTSWVHYHAHGERTAANSQHTHE